MSDVTARRRLGRALAVATALLMAVAATAGAVEVWMPQTEEVDLDELPRDTVEARFKHAAGLIGGGQPISGVNQLRELLEEEPEAEWAEEAHYLIALGLLSEGRNEVAFKECEALLERYPDTTRRDEAYEIQLNAARQRTLENVTDGHELYDRLALRAPSEEFELRCQKEKADATFEAEAYLTARDEYLAFVDYYPDSVWVPYCWYKMAECDLEMASEHQGGTELPERAQETFEAFKEFFPEHALAEEAAEKVAEAADLQAASYREIAEYYMGPGKSPTSALPYLEYITKELSETDQADWAAAKIEEIMANEPIPLRGRFKECDLPSARLKRADDIPPEPEQE